MRKLPVHYLSSLPFQLMSHMELHDWQTQFTLTSQQDQRELLEYLAEIQNSQELVHATVDQTSHGVRQMMAMLQTASGFTTLFHVSDSSYTAFA